MLLFVYWFELLFIIEYFLYYLLFVGVLSFRMHRLVQYIVDTGLYHVSYLHSRSIRPVFRQLEQSG